MEIKFSEIGHVFVERGSVSRDGRHRCDSRARHCSRGRPRTRAKVSRWFRCVASARRRAPKTSQNSYNRSTRGSVSVQKSHLDSAQFPKYEKQACGGNVNDEANPLYVLFDPTIQDARDMR